MSNFNPELFQCGICEDKMRSSYPGQFVKCQCGHSFVDQTVHYGRFGGAARSVSSLILDDLKDISGIGYQQDDVLALYEEILEPAVLPLNKGALIFDLYTKPSPDFGGSSAKDLVQAGRGHKVIELLQAKKEGY